MAQTVAEVVVLKPNTGQAGGRLPLESNTAVTIGREADADIRIRLPEVSRSQAVLRVTDNKVFLVNRSRTNPTVIESSMFHGGAACSLKAEESYLLRDAQVFVIAGRRFRLEYRPQYAHYSAIPVVASIVPVASLAKPAAAGSTPKRSAPGTPLTEAAQARLLAPQSASKALAAELGSGARDENAAPTGGVGSVLPAGRLTAVLAKAATSGADAAAVSPPAGPASSVQHLGQPDDEDTEEDDEFSGGASAHRLLLPMSPLPHAIAAVLPSPGKGGPAMLPAPQSPSGAAAAPVAAAIAVIRVGASALVTSGLPPASPRAPLARGPAAPTDGQVEAATGEDQENAAPASPPPPASLTPEAAAAATAAAVADMSSATGLPPGALDSPSAVHLSPTTRNTRFNTAMLGPNVTFEFPAMAVVPQELDPEAAAAAAASNAADALPQQEQEEEGEEEDMFGSPPAGNKTAWGSNDMEDDADAAVSSPPSCIGPAADVHLGTGEAGVRLADDGRLLQRLGADGTAALAVARSPRRASLALVPLPVEAASVASPPASSSCAFSGLAGAASTATPPRSAARSVASRGSTSIASTPGSILRRSTMSVTRGAGALPTPIARAVASRRVVFGEDRVRLIPCKEEAMHKYHLTPPQEDTEEVAAVAAGTSSGGGAGAAGAAKPSSASVAAEGTTQAAPALVDVDMPNAEEGAVAAVDGAPSNTEGEGNSWGGVCVNLSQSFCESMDDDEDEAVVEEAEVAVDATVPVANALMVVLSMPRLPSPLQRDIIARAASRIEPEVVDAADEEEDEEDVPAPVSPAATAPAVGSGVHSPGGEAVAAASPTAVACEWTTLPADSTGRYVGPVDDVATGVIAGRGLWPASPEGDGTSVHPPTASSTAAADAAYDFVYGVGADEATEDEESILSALVDDACNSGAVNSKKEASPMALQLPPQSAAAAASVALPSLAAAAAACFRGGPVAPPSVHLTFSPFLAATAAVAADPRTSRGRASVIFSSDHMPLSVVKEGDVPSGAPTPVASRGQGEASPAPQPLLPPPNAGALWGLGLQGGGRRRSSIGAPGLVFDISGAAASSSSSSSSIAGASDHHQGSGRLTAAQRRRRRSSTTGFPLMNPNHSLFAAVSGEGSSAAAPSAMLSSSSSSSSLGGAQRVVSSAARRPALAGAGRVSIGGSGATDIYEPAAKRCKV